MSPHVWQGPTAAEDWYADALAEGGSTLGLRTTTSASVSHGMSTLLVTTPTSSVPAHLRLQPSGQTGKPNRLGVYGGRFARWTETGRLGGLGLGTRGTRKAPWVAHPEPV